uniref:Putative YadA domain-containing structural protein n=1 Tax=viral metagenome TaxID=1070528 RepID=A0A6M3JLX8_9ZZZZ
MKNLVVEQAANGSSYKTANLLADLDSNFTEIDGDTAALDLTKAPKNNPIFTGTVTIPDPPVNASDAATKNYVDTMIATGVLWVEPVEDIVAVPPSPGVLGSRYIRSTDNVILTNTAPDVWAETVPDTGTTTYVKGNTIAPDNEVGWYNFNGTDWVYIGASGNHNDLTSIQGGGAAEYYHLTVAQHTIATQASTDALNGYLSAADHATFNAKAPTAGPTFTGAVAVPDTSFTYAKLQNASANVVLGRAGTAGQVTEIACTAAGRALIDDATTADQRTTIGLGNVTNESKATMFANPTFTGTVAGVTKTHVGLGNCDNTSDANKPVSSLTQTALNLKANIASPTLTGTPLAPTAVIGTNNTQIATTAFVATAIGVGGSFQIFTDGVSYFRQIVRNGHFCLDQTIAPAIDFSGIENIGWGNIRAEKLP